MACGAMRTHMNVSLNPSAFSDILEAILHGARLLQGYRLKTMALLSFNPLTMLTQLKNAL